MKAIEAGAGANRIWFDTEFIEDGKTIDLISIGLVRSDGATYYAETDDYIPGKASQWVKDNVLVHLKGGDAIKPRDVIAREIVEFVGEEPEFWAYYADYDWVALCQLYGTMMQLPEGWPMFCRDIKQRAVDLGNPKLPEQTSTEHHALADALWNKGAWESLASGELVPASAVAAERERCAQAAEGNSPSFNMSQALNECRDSEAGFHSGRIAAAKSIRSLSPEPSTSGEWRDISTAPDDGTEILGYWRGSKTHAIISWSIDGWWKDNADHSAVSPPTHWMPLPEPPAMLTAATKDGERK